MPNLTLTPEHKSYSDMEVSYVAFPSPVYGYDAENTLARMHKASDIGGTNYRYFIRYKISLPAGTTVNTATMTFTGVSTGGAATEMDFDLLDTENAPAFVTDQAPASTTNKATWSSVPAWTAGIQYTSDDISAAVQDFIDNALYQPGNYMGLRMVVTGGVTSQTRNAYSANSDYPPRLNLNVAVPALTANDLTKNDVVTDANRGSPTSRSCRLSFTEGQQLVSELGTTTTEWQIFKADQIVTDNATSTDPYPIIIRTDDLYANVETSNTHYLDIWLPPYEEFKFRARRLFNDASEYEAWSPFYYFTAPGYLNSFEVYQLLSDEVIDPIIIT